MQAAKDFREGVQSGAKKADFTKQNASGDAGNGNGEDAPF